MSDTLVNDRALMVQDSPAGWQGYLQHVYSIPVLSEVEEQQLFNRLKEHDDVEAARQLVMSHLRYVVFIAKSYAGYGLPLEDLVQQGNVGLMKSVKRFDPGFGVRLATYAVHWIKAEIHDYIIRNWRLIKVATTKAQRKLFFNLRKSRKHLQPLREEEAKRLAEDLNVSVDDVKEMDMRLKDQDCFFDAGFGDNADEGSSHSAKSIYLEDWSGSPENRVIDEEQKASHEEQLRNSLQLLDDRRRDIVESRWLADQKTSLKVLAEKYGISLERVRQLEQEALQILRRHMSVV